MSVPLRVAQLCLRYGCSSPGVQCAWGHFAQEPDLCHEPMWVGVTGSSCQERFWEPRCLGMATPGWIPWSSLCWVGSTTSQGHLFHCSFREMNPAGAPGDAGSEPYRPVMWGNGEFQGLCFPSGFSLHSTAPAHVDVT